MHKQEIIEFFDTYAADWDADMVRNETVIEAILDNAKVSAGKDVLDVACGTGVLIPDYLARNVKSVIAVDISPNMVKIAKSKFAQENVHIVCADVETAELGKYFDCIVVYNAFPHFFEQERLIKRLSELLKPDGSLTIAHGMSRERLNRHHSGAASKVSVELMPIEELAGLCNKYLIVQTCISDENMYQIVAKKE